MDLEVRERRRVATDLRRAISCTELEVHYQPQVSFINGEVQGYEALVRWQHPELGHIPPDRFIAIAEETGQISEIGRWVLEQSCLEAATWQNDEKKSPSTFHPINCAACALSTWLKQQSLIAALTPVALNWKSLSLFWCRTQK